MKSGLYVRPRTHAQCDIMSNFGLSITVYRGYLAELAEEGNTVVNLRESKEKRETRLFRWIRHYGPSQSLLFISGYLLTQYWVIEVRRGHMGTYFALVC